MAKKRKIHIKKHTNSEEEMNFLEGVGGGELENHEDQEQDKDEAQMQENETGINANELPLNESHNLGDYLKFHRNKKNLTVQHIAHVTKISSKNLQLLEDNNLDALPNKIYIAGYVKNYAKVLSLDENACLDLLDNEYHKDAPVVVQEEHAPTQEESSTDNTVNIKIIAIICVVVFIISLIFLFAGGDTNEAPKKEGTITEVPQETLLQDQEILPQSLSAETPLQSEIMTKEEEIDEEPEVAKPIVKKEAVTKEVIEKKEEVVEEVKKEVTEASKKIKEKTFYKMRPPLYSTMEETESNSFNTIAPDEVKAKYIEGQQNVFIKTNGGDSWVTYKTENSPIKQRYLQDGNYTFITGEEVRVAIGNIGIVQINLNKKPIEIKSKTGVKNIVFPEENSSKYQMPLFVYNKETNSFKTAEEYIELLEIQNKQEKKEP